MFHLVPLAGAGREVADRHGEAGLIGELLQLELPQPQPIAVAAAGIGGDEDALRLRVDAAAFGPPPPADRGDGEGTGIVVGTDVDEARVASDVVDTVGVSSRDVGAGEVVALDVQRLLGRQPLLTLVFVVAEDLLLLRVNRDDRQALAQILLDLSADVPELRIPVGMIRPLLSLAVALQAVVLIVQQLRHFHVTDRMVTCTQAAGNHPRALADPAQRGLRIPSGVFLDHLVQELEQLGISNRNGLAPGSASANPSRHQRLARANLTHAFENRLARETDGPVHQRDPAVAQTHRLIRRRQAARAFVQVWPDRTQLPLQLGKRSLHAQAA